MDFYGEAQLLTAKDIENAAIAISATVPQLKAFLTLEAKASGYGDRLPSGKARPYIVFEPHIFHRLTNGQFDKSNPNISYRTAKIRAHPVSQNARYAQLREAFELNKSAAVQATTWGIMSFPGIEYKNAGFKSTLEFVESMKKSEWEQLMATIHWLQNKTIKYKGETIHLGKALALGNSSPDSWVPFSEAFVGPGYVHSNYHINLARLFRQNNQG